MAGTYTEAHRKYFLAHKEEIYLRNREKRRAYMKLWTKRNKNKIKAQRKARELQRVRQAVYSQKID